jgi:glyoxylase-like metal-dependent hydrolase (beta-lactamase superfamily II)
MKNTLTIFIMTFFGLVHLTNAQAVFQNNDLKITPVEGHTWVIETTDKTTMYLIEGEKKALLIDTGTKCEKLDEVIKQVTTKPVEVVLTHAHNDHAGNIRYFNEIFMHPADTILLNKDYKGKLTFIDEGYVFDLGKRKIEVRYMPAHTPGSIVLIDKVTSSAFTGDAFGSGQVWLQLRPVAPMKTYLESVKKMQKIMDQGITKLYCGHYFYAGEKALGRDYLESMQKLAETLIAGDLSKAQPYSVKVSIGCDTPMLITEGTAGIVFDPDHLN